MHTPIQCTSAFALPVYINISSPSSAIGMSSLILLEAYIISQLSPSWTNAPGALVAFLLVVKHNCSFFLLFVLSFYILLHLHLPVCWLRPAGPAVPTLMSPLHLGQHAVVVSLYLILSFKHPVCELQLLSVDAHTFVFAIEILGCNFGWWHTMIGTVH